jgi:hypothetical protein
MKRLFFWLFLLVGTFTVFADNTNKGQNGLAYLKIAVDARAVGMGEAYTAVAEDASAVYWNPAGMLKAKRSNVLFNHNEWIQDIRGEFLALSLVRKKSAWGFHLRSFNIGDIPVRVIASSEPLENTSAHYFSAGISYARRLHQRFDIGLTLKYLFEKIYVESAAGIGLDLGLMYRAPVKGLQLGFSMQNFGRMNNLKSESSDLPLITRLGGYYQLPVFSTKVRGSLSSDIVLITNENIRIHLGTEWLLWQQLALRAGLLSGYDSRSVTLGLGFNRSSIRLDYGFIPFGEDLGSTHRFTLSFLL